MNKEISSRINAGNRAFVALRRLSESIAEILYHVFKISVENIEVNVVNDVKHFVECWNDTMPMERSKEGLVVASLEIICASLLTIVQCQRVLETTTIEG